jgi:hypothetical protein
MAKKAREILSAVEELPIDYDKEKDHAHLMEQYKLYVEMVDRLSARPSQEPVERVAPS